MWSHLHIRSFSSSSTVRRSRRCLRREFDLRSRGKVEIIFKYRIKRKLRKGDRGSIARDFPPPLVERVDTRSNLRSFTGFWGVVGCRREDKGWVGTGGCLRDGDAESVL